MCGPQGSADETPTSLQQRNSEVKWLLEVTRQERFQAALFLEPEHHFWPGVGGGGCGGHRDTLTT